jgi:lipoprotein-anchoring transpeptidase ErfK/SrfK
MPVLAAVAAVIALAGTGLSAGVAAAQPVSAAPSVHAAPAKHKDKDKKDKDKKKGGAKSGSPCASTAKACVDLSSHQAWLTDGAGHVTFGPVMAHGGSDEAKTPRGSFKVLSKDAHYFSTEFKAPMPYSVFFYPGDAFHADNPATASNGCVHLAMASAQRFFAALNPGDAVQIKG